MSTHTDVFVATPAEVAADDVVDRLDDLDRPDAFVSVRARNLDVHGLPQIEELLLGIRANGFPRFMETNPARFWEDTGHLIFALPEELTRQLSAVTAEQRAKIRALFVEPSMDDDGRAAFKAYRQRMGFPPSDGVLGADLVHVAREAQRHGKQLYLYVWGF